MMIKKIMEDGEGKILLFADNKQFVYDEAAQSLIGRYPLPEIPAGYGIADLAIDGSSGMYWFTGKQGSLLFDPRSKQFIPPGKEKGAAFDSLFSVKSARYPFIDKDGNWWLVNWLPFTQVPPVLYSYNPKQAQLQQYEKIRAYKPDSYYEIWSLFQQTNGTLWIYGMGLLAYYDIQQNRFVHIASDAFRQNGIEYDFVSGLSEDKEHNVWVSTNNGLYRFNIQAQVFHNTPNLRPGDTSFTANAVSNVIQARDKSIWVSTWGGGVFTYSNNLQPILNPTDRLDPDSRSLHAGYTMQRSNGEIWTCTQKGALKIYDTRTGKYTSLVPAVLRGEMLSQLLEDATGNVWIGSTSGLLVKCDKGNWQDTAHAYQAVLHDAGDVMKLYEDKAHHIWVCTATDGVYELDSKDGTVLQHLQVGADNNKGLLNDGATDILQYDDSTYLIASDGLCIWNSRTKTFRYLTPADGLPAEHITNIIADKQKRIWVALDGGLYRLNIQNNLYVSYNAADGITNDIFQVGSASLLQDGRIAIATTHDFLVFDPEKAINKEPVPAPRITGFVLGNKQLLTDSLAQLHEVELAYDNTFIHIQLSTLSFRDRYYMYYMLEGLDNTWKQVSNNEITYQYLPPGNYRLKLLSKNGDGVESKSVTTLLISVTPPFWKSWWFYSMLVVVVGGLLFWLEHERVKRKTNILRMRSDIADGLHRDINAALGNITILSEMARIKADREPEKSKEFIEQIHTRSQNMTVAMNDMLWSIDPSNDSMNNFMLRFMEYVDALKTESGVQIDVLTEKNAANLRLSMQARNDIFWLFKGGITNVVKTGGKHCRIHISYEKPALVYTLEFDKTASDMQQLNNLRQRKELSDKLATLHATLDFREHSTKVVFVLRIPVKTDAL